MKLCGLTGGVGMGKSTAAGFLSQLGVKVVDTDEIARELVQPGRPVLLQIQSEFGDGIVSPAGELKRDQLARLVFADGSARKRLEDILHPRIRESWLQQVANWRQEGCPVAVVVIPLLFETQAETLFDDVICIACSPAAQQERLLARGWSPDQIRQRIAAQLPVAEKISRARFVIWTEGSPEIHRRQIQQILEKL
jgi:dephospho-CoA kinase